MARFRDVLKNRSFLFLWLGQIVSSFGDWLNKMALIALVYKKAPGSTMELAKLLFFIIIPVFIIGPIAGVYVDRWDRKRVMIVSDVLRGCLVLLIPFFILYLKSFLPVYVLVFLIFSITRFFFQSKMAIIPDIVPRDMLLIANTLSDTARAISGFIALAAAGIIIERIGAINGFYIDSLTYFISALFISNMIIKGVIGHLGEDILKAREAFKKSIRKSLWAEIKEGILFIAGRKEMKFVLRTFFLLMAGIGAVSCVLIVFIQEAFGSVTKHLSFLMMFLALGGFIGMLFYGRFGQKLRKEKVILSCFMLSGIFMVIFTAIAGFAPSVWTCGTIVFLLGVSAGPIMVSLNTIVHESIPQEARGRIFSSLEAVAHLAFLVFMFIAAFAAEYFGRIWILAFCGVIFFVWGAVGVFSRD
ncbi:MAG: MFS transporter [Candidatus Omnitrophota bacterium]|nr:MFS transporter [Candidatus Omnitrophota bacterium]